MTDQLDPARLRELHEAAAKVPWEQAPPGSNIILLDHPEQDDASIIAECDWSNDAALIVALRNAVPAILAMADENAALKAEVARLREVVGEIRDLPGEINPSNYDHDDACELNRQFCYAISVASAALAGGGHD